MAASVTIFFDYLRLDLLVETLYSWLLIYEIRHFCFLIIIVKLKETKKDTKYQGKIRDIDLLYFFN